MPKLDSQSKLDLQKLGPYLKAEVPNFGDLLSASKFSRGQSNPTYVLETSTGRFALRRKPDGVLLKSAHAVDREFRVQHALKNTPVPVPCVHHLCEDKNLVGTMFYVMDFIQGQNFIDPRLQELEKTERGHVYDQMNLVMANLHSVDLQDVGLSDFGAPGNYFERQIGRWTKQYKASETNTIGAMNELMLELNQRDAFDDGQRTLVHGDFRIDNLIFDTENFNCLAVLDWELSTTGHPYADLASFIMQLRMPLGEDGRGLDGINRQDWGVPSEDEFISSYCQRRNISGIPNMGYFLAFGFFRMAAVLQGVKKRALEGNASDPQSGLKLGAFIDQFAERGLKALNE